MRNLVLIIIIEIYKQIIVKYIKGTIQYEGCWRYNKYDNDTNRYTVADTTSMPKTELNMF